MNQEIALEIMLSGESVLLTGSAGAGKTFVLNQFIRSARGLGKHVSVTATTGLAATHLNGTTIHSWSGMGIHDSISERFLDNLSKARRDTISKTDVLIIDEISMLHDFRLDMVDQICRAVRQNDQPFGGIQVIFSGDFFQLPPINRNGSRQGSFVVYSEVWRELDPVVCYLTEQHRQEDDELLDILNAMRSGDLHRHQVEKLLSRVDKQPADNLPLTALHTINVDVDRINKKKLAELDGEMVSYTQTVTGGKSYVESLQRSVLAPEILELKIGALVMAVKNSTDRKYANGSIGTVISFDNQTGYPSIEFRNGHVVNMMPDTWEMRDGEVKRASITQIPLRLAWAITVHKSQGMTLDAASIDLGKAFVEGMGYVALSRVKNLSDLYLVGINKMAIRVSDVAKEIDVNLRSKAAKDEARFSNLQELINKRREKEKLTPKTPAKKSWADRLEEMRKEYPNAYRPWTHQQDELLKEKFQNGTSVKDLSKELGRHENSILIRLKKYFGEDISI